MDSVSSKSRSVKLSPYIFAISFISLELSVAAGAIIGVAFLNADWVFGLGMSNMQVLSLFGIFPSIVLSLLLSMTSKELFLKCAKITIPAVFGVSILLSYFLGIAMVGI